MSSRIPRVAVTRDEPRDGPLSTALRDCGLEPVACATVREDGAPDPARLEVAARALADYDWLVVTSRRAIVSLQAARANTPLPRSLRTAAVGGATAAALIERGAVEPLTADGSGVTALIDALRAAERWPGKRVLLPRAEDGRRELGDTLRAEGADVDEVTAYRTVAMSPAEVATAWRSAAPDAVVVASPSAARALVAGVGAEDLRGLQLVAAIGPTTVAALDDLGVPACAPRIAGFQDVAELVAQRLQVTGARTGRGGDRLAGKPRALRHEGGAS